MKAALAKILKDVAKKKIKKKIANASSFFSGEEGITGIVALSAPLIPILIGTVIVIGAIMLPILLVNQYIQDANASEKILFEDLDGLLVLSDWCKPGDTNCEKQATQKYYEELEKIYNKYKEKNVELDVQLITATIFYANTHRNDLFTESDDSTDIEQGNIKLSDIDRLASNMVNGNSIDYEKYRNYLISTYIPNRFSSLYSDRDDKQNAIEEIADAIMGFKNETTSIVQNNQSYGSCKYKTTGKEIDTSNLSVVLLSCDGSQELERVDFEKYIKGVVYGEVGNAWPDEVLKAQAIAARSFTLTRNQTMCPGRPNDCEYGYNPNTNEIRMRNCEGDQVYCDYKEGCQKYNYNGYNSLISGTMNPRLQVYKQALSEADAKHFEDNLNEVNGKVLLREDNEIYAAAYIDVDQRAWNTMYNNNNSLNYNDILIKHYWDKTKTNLTINSNCTNYGSTGDFAEWKQFDPRWAEVNIGSATLHSSGCLVTSIAIQMQRSGTVTIPDFNPATFANRLTQNGGFSSGGGLLWDPLRKTMKEITNDKFKDVNLEYSLSGTKENKINKLNEFINSGKLLVLGVKNEGHWIAIDRIEGNNVFIFDPGDSYTNEVSQKYDWGGVTKVQIYEVVP